MIVVKVYICCISKKSFHGLKKKVNSKSVYSCVFWKSFFLDFGPLKTYSIFLPPNILRTCPEEVKEMGVSIYGKVPELVQGGSLKNCCVRTHGFKPHLYYQSSVGVVGSARCLYPFDILRTVTCSVCNAEVMGSNPIQSKSFFS